MPQRDRIRRARDAGASPMRRFRSIDAKVGDDGILRIVASTDAAVRFGSWREVLVHTDSAIDRKGAHSLLINHDPNQIAGTIRSMTIRNGELHAEVEVMAGAKLASGVTVREAVNAGALRGVSIGYDYDQNADANWNEADRSVRVNHWRLLEMTLTPIPADADAGVRSCPFDSNLDHSRNATVKFKITLARFLAIAAAFSHLSQAALGERCQIVDADSDDTAKGERDLRAWAESQPKPNGDEGARAREIAALRDRAEKAETENRLRALATEHGVDTKDLDFTRFTLAEGTAELLKRKATAERTAAPAGGVTVTKDAGDKMLAHVRGALHATSRIPLEKEHEATVAAVGGARFVPMKSLLRSLARASGESDADYWNDMQLSAWAAPLLDLRSENVRTSRRDGQNKITAGFSNILANVANKAVIAGMAGYNAATWQLWCTQRNVANFLQVTNAALSSGRLIKTAEGEAFPELKQKDGGYNSQLGLYGATVSLTWQALVNDQLSQFMDSLRRIGGIAALTVDRRVYYVLLQATWTNDLSTTAGLATASNLDKPRAALKAKKSPAGEKMGTVARFLLHDPANAVNAQVATGAIYGPGQTTAPSQGSRQIQPIESHWISDTDLKTGVLTTDYYLTGDGNLVDTVLVNFLEGVGFSPIIMPYDPGAVAGENWKVMLPFEATIPTYTDSAGTTGRIPGVQKATA